MCFYLANCIPNIENKRYLELGTHAGVTFRQVLAKDKTGVDPAFDTTYRMTTDEFFEKVAPGQKWDIIFIDACHEYDYILRDYNNAVKHLSPGGVIFVHDMVPPTADFVPPHYCGDGYKLLHHAMLVDGLLSSPPTVFPLRCNPKPGHKPADGGTDGDCGLTTFTRPFLMHPPLGNKDLSYQDFMATLTQDNTYVASQVQDILRRGGVA